MREILFRGKRIDNGEWVEGSLLFDPDLGYAQIMGFEYWTSETGKERGGFSELIDTNTVGRYTGLKDKNGKRIFEGDVVQYDERQFGGEDAPVVCLVGFEEGGFCVHHYFLNNWLRNAINGNIQLEGIEVIGNIHDNPELMEG